MIWRVVLQSVPHGAYMGVRLVTILADCDDGCPLVEKVVVPVAKKT